ncbi:inner centromere protein A [Nilaparvata lugens]|uniref:inner centromere protein A n=1 Tax=Nilaparvata lugens TaxID=108931 RepID=UPI00193D7F69|nr:inner centromere protein A [Nilaparvata lugens]
MDYKALPRLDVLKVDNFTETCDLLLRNKLESLRQRAQTKSANETTTFVIDENVEGCDFGDTTTRRPRRTASKTADLKIKKNLHMPVKLRRPSAGESLSGTFKWPKTNRTKVIKKNPDSTTTAMASAVEKSIGAIDQMNLVKKRTEQFEKMTKEQQVALTPSRRNEGAVECVAATSSLDNVNNNVLVESATTVVSVEVENNVVESTTTTTTKRVTRTKTRNMIKQTMANDDASTSAETEVFVKPRVGRTKIRKDLHKKLNGVCLDDESEPEPKVDRETMAQKAREKQLAREKAEQERKAEEARKVEEARKATEEKEAAKVAAELAAKKAEEEAARRAEEARKAELEKKEKEQEEKLAKIQEAAAKKKEQDKLKKLALEKKRQEKLSKQEAIKKKHEELNKKREMDAKKREELLQASAAKKKEAAAEANSKAQHKAADAKENLKPNQTAKPPVKPVVHPVVNQLKNTTFSSGQYNMTPPRDEREPQKPKTVDDYGIDEAASSDSSDDESNPKKIVPVWAKSSELKEIVEIQSQLPLEMLQFAMGCDTEPYRTLGYVNKIKRPRTSSAVWHTPINLNY